MQARLRALWLLHARMHARMHTCMHAFYFLFAACMQPDTIRIDRPGQFVLPRSSFVVTAEYVEARCTIGLPVGV